MLFLLRMKGSVFIDLLNEIIVNVKYKVLKLDWKTNYKHDLQISLKELYRKCHFAGMIQ